MATTLEVSKDSIIILYKGGRLPTWHDLTPAKGFKLMTPQRSWERFWVIEFPTLTGAEAWIDAKWHRPMAAIDITNITPHGIGDGATFPNGHLALPNRLCRTR